MAHEVRKLAPIIVPKLPPGRHSDGGGLYLVVDPSGARRWLLFLHIDGKRREMGLGGFPAVSLAQARDLASDARSKLAGGVNPIAARKTVRTANKAAGVTFGAFADEYCDTHGKALSNPKHRAQWRMTLGPRYCGSIRSKPVGTLTTEDVLGVLKPMWHEVPETASRLRMRLERVLDAAKVKGLLTGDNPARWRGHLDHLLPRRTKALKGHHAAMPFGDVPAFIERLQGHDNAAALALQFAILTACRTGEVLGARWDEIDLNAKVWIIPAERMKARREHRVPLTDAALDVLARAKGLSEEWVFPGPSLLKPLSNMAMEMVLRRMQVEDATPHGFRSSFRDWAAETTAFPNEVVEMALAHTIANRTEAAYRRGDLFEKRKALMTAWAGFVTRPVGANVVDMKTAAAAIATS